MEEQKLSMFFTWKMRDKQTLKNHTFFFTQGNYQSMSGISVVVPLKTLINMPSLTLWGDIDS